MIKFLPFILLLAFISSFTTISAQESSDGTGLSMKKYDDKIEKYKRSRAINATVGAVGIGATAFITKNPLTILGFPIGMAFFNQAGNNNLKIYQLEIEKEIASVTSQELKEQYIKDVHRRYTRSANAKLIGGSVLAGAGLGIIALGIITYSPSDGWADLGIVVIGLVGSMGVLAGIPFIVSGISLKKKARLIMQTGNLPQIVSTSSGFPTGNGQYMAMGFKIPFGW